VEREESSGQLGWKGGLPIQHRADDFSRLKRRRALGPTVSEGGKGHTPSIKLRQKGGLANATYHALSKNRKNNKKNPKKEQIFLEKSRNVLHVKINQKYRGNTGSCDIAAEAIDSGEPLTAQLNKARKEMIRPGRGESRHLNTGQNKGCTRKSY